MTFSKNCALTETDKIRYHRSYSLIKNMLHHDDLTTLNGAQDDVETIVGPSVKVEGDFISKGNVVIEGTVMGSVKTDQNLRVEEGAHISADVRANNIRVAGEIKGNVHVAGLLELTASARVFGDIETKTLVVAAGATLHGNCIMDGEKLVKQVKVKSLRAGSKESDLEVEFEEEEERVRELA